MELQTILHFMNTNRSKATTLTFLSFSSCIYTLSFTCLNKNPSNLALASAGESKSGAKEMESKPNAKASSLRWAILRQSLLHQSCSANGEDQSKKGIERISRRTTKGFNLIPSHVVEEHETKNSDGSTSRDARVCYTLPIDGQPQLHLTHRVNSYSHLRDFEICNKYNIDTTGLVCSWPSEDVLSYFCLCHADMFRNKKVVELGSGYGLAGFVIATVTQACEVLISDGNPQVVDYIQHNIEENSEAFGGTKVKSMILHWDQEETLNILDTFDIIIASDCTFFKEFHQGLARTVKTLLRKTGSSQAILLCPKRGDSLDMFLEVVKETGLHYSLTENYDEEVWNRHQRFINSDENDSWSGYEKDHCYPYLIRFTL